MDLGNKPAGTVVRFFFNTYDSAGALVTASSLAASDVEIYKAGSTTQRASDNGITVTVDFDGVTGLHMVAIDLSDNSDSGFYAAGSDYAVSLGPFTVDTQTVGLVRSFRIVAAEVNAGFPQVDTRRLWDYNNAEYVEPGIDSSHHGLLVGNATGDIAATIASGVWGRDPANDGFTTSYTTYGQIAVELPKVPKSDGTTTWNATALASINTQCDTALSDYGALRPTTAGRTLDVTATGAAGVDWGNVENPSTSVNLSGTTTNLVNTATTLTNAPSDSAGVGTLLTRVTEAVATSAQATAIQADLPARITKNTALANFPFKMTNTAGTALTGLTITATRSIDGAAFGACANSASEISDGWYKIDLAAGDLNGNNIVLRFTGTGAKATEIQIVTQNS